MEWSGAKQRHDGWLSTLSEAGIEPGASVEGNWTAESGYQAVRRLLERGALFTALFAGNDQMALGAMRALREAGRRVPRDVSVVGFDDVPEAAYYEPPLTTIRQDFWLWVSRRSSCCSPAWTLLTRPPISASSTRP